MLSEASGLVSVQRQICFNREYLTFHHMMDVILVLKIPFQTLRERLFGDVIE